MQHRKTPTLIIKGFQVSFTLSCLRGHFTPTLAPEFSSFPKDLDQKKSLCSEASALLRRGRKGEGESQNPGTAGAGKDLRAAGTAHPGDCRKSGTFQEYKLNLSSRQATRWLNEPAEALSPPWPHSESRIIKFPPLAAAAGTRGRAPVALRFLGIMRAPGLGRGTSRSLSQEFTAGGAENVAPGLN